MWRAKLITVVSIFISVNTFSQGWYPSGSRSMSMGNASVTNGDVYAFFNNPAALSEVEELQFGLSYENRFLLKELQTQSLACAVPLAKGVLSVGGHVYGYDQFRSYKTGIGYSMKLGEHFMAGVQMNYQGIQLNQNYGSAGKMTAEAGLLFYISDDWNVGVSAFNLGRTELLDESQNSYSDRFSSIMRLGTSYRFSDVFRICAEIEKDLDFKSRVKLGLEYQIIPDFYIRSGFSTNRPEFAFGFSYHFKRIYLDLGSSYDQILGWSPNFSFTYALVK